MYLSSLQSRFVALVVFFCMCAAMPAGAFPLAGHGLGETGEGHGGMENKGRDKSSAEKEPDEKGRRLYEMMISDLGGIEKQDFNSGRTYACVHRGKKMVTVTKSEDSTRYDGEYNNCREHGVSKDGIFTVLVGSDGELIDRVLLRSINGELFIAVRENDVKLTRALLKKHADVNYTESIKTTGDAYISEWSPLMSAAIVGNLDMVKLLVKSGAWINYMNSHAINALWLAANNGRVEIVRYLIKNGAYINNRSIEDVTPLMTAATGGHYDVAELLIKSGAALNVGHKEGDTALMSALANGHSRIGKLLINAGADINIQNRSGISALLIAVNEGNAEMVKTLLARGANKDTRTNDGKTALDVATLKGYNEIAALLTPGVK